MKKAFVIAHSHWDREWYLPFEVHRMKLVELIDTCMELFEKDPEFKSFHLDGQTIVVEDYLAVRPQNREKLLKYIKEGRFLIGPWYMLQDEFLTGSEANVRNLLVGMEQAEEYGGLCKIGYFPDSFGNAGQMPQILKQAGMDAIAFGRGVKPVGFNNQIGEGNYESMYSEMMWESPDGSSLLGILFANWYCNGMEIPTDEEVAKKFWDRGLSAVGRFASTPNYLFMNGCDHQPVQTDLSKALETARKLYPDVEFIHGSFPEYVEQLKKDIPENLSTIKGELINQDTNGWDTLLNTASSRIYLKQMNRKGESALDRIAEPLCMMASLSGREYPHDLLAYSWKTLMQNHPHDSICGCSVDEVHQDMVNRFKRSLEVANKISEEAIEYIGENADCSCFANTEGKVHPFIVCNPAGWSRTGVVTLDIDVVRHWTPADPRISAREVDAIPMKEYRLIDENGTEIPCTVEDKGIHFGYTLPKDKFRQPYMARTVQVTFEAKNVPSLSYQLYALEEKAPTVKLDTMVTSACSMENENLFVVVAENGTYTVTDKTTGHVYAGLGYFEDTGDVGNEYIYRKPLGTEAITTENAKAIIEVVEDTQQKATIRVTVSMEIPKGENEVLAYEKAHLQYPGSRRGGRCEETVEMKFVSDLTLERSAKGLKVITHMDNKAKDHRLRVMFPTDIQTATHKVESIFEVKSRNNKHNSCWRNPSECERQQNLVSITDGDKSLMIANRGLYEYEITPTETGNIMAVTILRSVSELGDWGIFETPEAQVLGYNYAEYEIVPHTGDVAVSGAQVEAYLYQTELSALQLYNHTLEPAQKATPVRNFLNWSGTGLNLTGIKAKQKGSDMIIRWVNNNEENSVLRIEKNAVITNAYKSNVIEQELETLQVDENGYFNVVVKPYEIITIGVKQ